MKKQFLLLSLAFLLIAVSLSAPAQAATQPANLHFMSPIAPGATVMKYKGEVANAFFSQTSDGCLYTDTYLFAGAGKLQNPPGAPEANNWANVSVYRYDSCTGTWLTGASGSVAINNATFQIDQQLNAAHLQTTVPMYDWMTGASFNLAVDLTWAGNGDLTRMGPFRILEIGNRTGRPEVQRASGVRQTIDSSITIVAKLKKGQLDTNEERITEYMRSSKSQGLQVILHPKNR